jgi:hypothetical protein
MLEILILSLQIFALIGTYDRIDKASTITVPPSEESCKTCINDCLKHLFRVVGMTNRNPNYGFTTLINETINHTDFFRLREPKR